MSEEQARYETGAVTSTVGGWVHICNEMPEHDQLQWNPEWKMWWWKETAIADTTERVAFLYCPWCGMKMENPPEEAKE